MIADAARELVSVHAAGQADVDEGDVERFLRQRVLEQLERADPLDVAFIDIGLPGGMDGYELARRIRSHPAGAHIRLVALTGYGFPEDRMQSRQAGFAKHLVKPVEPEALHRELSAVQRPRTN